MAASQRAGDEHGPGRPSGVVLAAVAAMMGRPFPSASRALEQHRVLIVESDHLVALDISQAFEEAGAQVVGLAPSVGTALALIARAGRLDGAVLDLNLRGGMASPVADELVRRGVPFLFATAVEARSIPARFAHVTHCEKPLNMSQVVPLLLDRQVRPEWPRTSQAEQPRCSRTN